MSIAANVFWPMVVIGILLGIPLLTDANPMGKPQQPVRVVAQPDGIRVTNVGGTVIQNARIVINDAYSGNASALTPDESRLIPYNRFYPFHGDRSLTFSGSVERLDIETRCNRHVVNHWVIGNP